MPEAAIVPERSRQFVYVVDAEERIERREVRTGRRQPGRVEIIGGLAAGEVIVVEGTQKALPGQPVRVIGGGPPAAEALAGKEPLP